MDNTSIVYAVFSSSIFGNSLALIGIGISIIGIGVSVFFGIYGEYKFNLVSKINKLVSHVFNKKTGMKMNITYQTKKDFGLIKNELKSFFRDKYDEYNLFNEKSSYITINFDIFSVKIIHTMSNEIFFDIVKTECGINDLNSRVRKLISIINEVNKKKGLFDKLKSCEITIYLPYKWDYVKLYPPKGFELENYKIEIQDKEDYNTKVAVRLNSISASGDSFEEIMALLQKLL